jgi:hypothetical protein
LNAFRGLLVTRDEKDVSFFISGKASRSFERGASCLTPLVSKRRGLSFFKKNSFATPAPKPTIANANGTIGFPSTAKASKGLPPR